MTILKLLKSFTDRNTLYRKKLTTFDNNCQMKFFITKTMTTGELIREKRELKGLLLRDISTQIGIDTAILSKIERGERKATKEQITKLAEILEIERSLILTQFLSEKILCEIQNEDFGIEALKVAEQTIKYGGTNNK